MIDGLVQSAIEVDEGIRAPEAARQFFAGDELARVFEQRQQQLDGLIAERCSMTILGELARTCIKGERSELIDMRRLDPVHHRPWPAERARVYHSAITKL